MVCITWRVPDIQPIQFFSFHKLSGLVRKFGDVLFMVKRISIEHLPMAVAFR